jgi:hypothetical protein
MKLQNAYCCRLVGLQDEGHDHKPSQVNVAAPHHFADNPEFGFAVGLGSLAVASFEAEELEENG